jgi:hypothetical protein
MRKTIILGVSAAAILFTGCAKENETLFVNKPIETTTIKYLVEPQVAEMNSEQSVTVNTKTLGQTRNLRKVQLGNSRYNKEIQMEQRFFIETADDTTYNLREQRFLNEELVLDQVSYFAQIGNCNSPTGTVTKTESQINQVALVTEEIKASNGLEKTEVDAFNDGQESTISLCKKNKDTLLVKSSLKLIKPVLVNIANIETEKPLSYFDLHNIQKVEYGLSNRNNK